MHKKEQHISPVTELTGEIYSIVFHTLQVGCMEDFRIHYSFAWSAPKSINILYKDISQDTCLNPPPVLMGGTNR